MQQESQTKRRGSAKPPASGGGSRIIRVTNRRATNGRDCPGGKGPTSLFSTNGSSNNSRGLAIVLYGIQDSCGLSSGDKIKRQQMMRELLVRRALSPPSRRLSLRWRNFQPTPSRLSTMSIA